ncbi:hypothetical protein [Legionella hackeliae]|uniref:DUF4116 domain-containing protein n=1 Tax=Legionella hackeliae TaxID=449 RepID=A0A0A8UR29_LEGHA|nr:hypothetical protein [Legionella hackeliae]KTD12905.1 hypothetical protein Lhac_1776 [Legionella hackeliae]CEK09214.1 protein of unknown function [Legionella hackeliae]STX49121.1 Uncharacterised protein [Legionella hackeliae]
MSTPEHDLNVAYDLAASAISENPKQLEEILTQDSLNFEQKQRLCLFAVQKDWSVIYDVPDSFMNDDIFIACIEQSHDYIQEIPAKYATPKLIQVVANLVDELEYVPPWLKTPEVCLKVIKRHWRYMDEVPDGDNYKIVYLAGIKQNWCAFFYIPEARRSDPEILAALKEVWRTQQIVFPEPFDMQSLYFIAVKENASLLPTVPEQYNNIAICLTALTKKPDLLEHLPQKLLTDVCIAWVRQSSTALANLPSRLRQEVINSIGLDNILANDFMIFPLLDSNKAYHQTIQQVLGGCEHLVVTKEGALGNDAEIQDSYLVYANASKRFKKTLHVDASLAATCLDRLRNNKSIDLVLLGHDPMFDGERKIGGFSPKEIIELLKEYPNINRVTLLTCNSVKAKVLEKEKEINQRLVKRSKNEVIAPCGLVLMSSEPDDNKSRLILEGLRNEHAFVLVKLKDKYTLFYLSQDGTAVKTSRVTLTDTQFTKLHKVIFPNEKRLPFPANADDIVTIRGGLGSEPLERKQFVAFYRIAMQENPYSKTNPNYKALKQFYNFFNHIIIDEQEYPKLKVSLLKTIVDMVIAAKLNRVISIKGFNYVLSVDTKDRRFIAGIRVSAYPPSYSKNNRPLFFDNSQNNLDSDAVEKEMDKIVNRTVEKTSGDTEEATEEELSQLKAITFVVK